MKNRVLVLLIVLALAVVTGASLVSAQGNTIKAVTLGETSLYAEANAEAEVVDTLAASSVVELLGQTSDFFEVDGGYVMKSDVLVLNLPALAPMVIASPGSVDSVAIFAEPNVNADIVTTVPGGTVAALLGAQGEFAFAQLADGSMGWSVASAWAEAPEGFAPALIALGSTDQVGVFAEPDVFGEIASTLTEGDVVYIYEDTGEDLVEVMLSDGSMGYVSSSYLDLLPMVWVDAQAGSDSEAAMFADADFGADVLGAIADGTPVVYLGEVDDFWVELYHPVYGMGYGLADSFSTPYTVATVQEANSLVRDGAGQQYFQVAQLQVGDKVVVNGVDESQEWFSVGVPYASYFDFNGGDTYMYFDLLRDQALEYDFDVELFIPVEEEAAAE